MVSVEMLFMLMMIILVLVLVLVSYVVSKPQQTQTPVEKPTLIEEPELEESKEEEEEEEDEVVEPSTYSYVYNRRPRYPYHNHAPKGHNWRNDHVHYVRDGNRFYQDDDDDTRYSSAFQSIQPSI